MSIMASRQTIGEFIANGILHVERLRIQLRKNAKEEALRESGRQIRSDIGVLRGLARMAGEDELEQALRGANRRLDAVAPKAPVPVISDTKLTISAERIQREYLALTRAYRQNGGCWWDARIVLTPVRGEHVREDPYCDEIARILRRHGGGSFVRADDVSLGNFSKGCKAGDWVALATVDAFCEIFKACELGELKPTGFVLERSALVMPRLDAAEIEAPQALSMTPWGAIDLAYACDECITATSSSEAFAMLAMSQMIGPEGQRALVSETHGRVRDESLVKHVRSYVIARAAERAGRPRGESVFSRLCIGQSKRLGPGMSLS